MNHLLRSVLIIAALLGLLIGYIELRLPVTVEAQGGYAVYEGLAVTGDLRLEQFRGQIAAFNGDCPDHWDELTALRGRFIVGLVDGGELAKSVGTVLTNGEVRRGGTVHPGPHYTVGSSSTHRSNVVFSIASQGTRLQTSSQIAGLRITTGDVHSGSLNQLPPAPYVQLRYCEYQP